MDSETRQMLAEVFAEDDAARAEFERHERERHETKQRSGDNVDDLIFKVTENARTRPIPQQQSTTTYDAAAQRGWDDYVTAHIRNALVENNKMLVDETAKFVVEFVSKKLDKERAERDALRVLITGMREEIKTLRSELGGKLIRYAELKEILASSKQ